jgi:galactokinase
LSDSRCFPTFALLPESVQRFEAPARVNLIGEHTDYTGGFVLPMAIPFHTVAQIAPGKKPKQYTFVSELYETVRHMASNDRSGAIQDWTDYPVGVLRELQETGIELPHFILKIGGDVPPASGLSSSASIEVASAVAILAFSAKILPAEELAVLCRRASIAQWR